jgi:hypothetical protein
MFWDSVAQAFIGISSTITIVLQLAVRVESNFLYSKSTYQKHK